MNKLLQNAFVPTATVKKSITLTDLATGEEMQADVYVRPLSFESVAGDIRTYGGDENDAIAQRIAYSIRDEHGAPIFTASQISGEDGKALSPQLTYELLRVIGEVNLLGKA